MQHTNVAKNAAQNVAKNVAKKCGKNEAQCRKSALSKKRMSFITNLDNCE